MADELKAVVVADSSQVAQGLRPAETALAGLDKAADKATESLSKLDKAKATPEVKITLQDQAIAKAKADIAKLRDEVAHGLIIGADTKDAQRQITALERSIKSLESKPPKLPPVDDGSIKKATAGLKELGSSIPGGGIFFGPVGLVAGFAAAGAGAVKMAADMETAKASLKSVIRDGGDANVVFNDIKKFADTTPFRFPELVDTAKTLASFGVSSKVLMDNLKGIGEAAAATGQPVADLALIYGQMLSIGKVQQQDVNQFAQRGVDIYGALAQAVGVSKDQVRGLIEAGKIGRAEIEKLPAAFQTLYSGSIARQADTFNGKLSTFEDKLGSIATKIGQDLLPAASALINIIGKVADVLSGPWAGVAIEIGIAVGVAKLAVTAFNSASRAAKAFATAEREVNIASGLFGTLLAAGTFLLEQFASNSDDASGSTEDFGKSLDFTNGALTDYNRQQAIASLTADKFGQQLVDNANKMGISNGVIADAALGNAQALAEIHNMIGANAEATEKAFGLGAVVQMGLLSNEIDKLAGKTGDANEEFNRVQSSAGGANKTLGQSVDYIGDVTKALENSLSAQDNYNKAVERSIDDLNILNGVFVDAKTAQADYLQAQADTAKALKENGRTLDLNTQKGRDNQKAIFDQAKALDDMVRARLRDRSQSGESTAAILKDYTKQRDSLLKTLGTMHLSGKDLKTYQDQLLATPTDISTQFTAAVDPKSVTDANKALNNVGKERWVPFNAYVTQHTIDKVNSILDSVGNGVPVKGNNQGGSNGSGGQSGFVPVPRSAQRDAVTGQDVAAFDRPADFYGFAPSIVVNPAATNVTVNVNDRRFRDLVGVEVRSMAGRTVRRMSGRRVVNV